MNFFYEKKLRANLKHEYVQLLFDCILGFGIRPVQETFTHIALQRLV